MSACPHSVRSRKSGALRAALATIRSGRALDAGQTDKRRYSAAGVVAEAHLATWSHSAKLLPDMPSPKRCGTRATITGSSSAAVLAPRGRIAVWRVRAGDPPVACWPGCEPNRRIASAAVPRSHA